MSLEQGQPPPLPGSLDYLAEDIQLPENLKRVIARHADAEREKHAKIIAAQGEPLAAGERATAADMMMARPLALQMRNLQTLVEVAVDKNSSVVFPAPLMSTIGELGSFLAREKQAARELSTTSDRLNHSEDGARPWPPLDWSPPSMEDTREEEQTCKANRPIPPRRPSAFAN